MARTTVDIDDPILRELKVAQREEGVSLGRLVSRLLAEALSRRKKSARPGAFRWNTKRMNARVDLADKEAVWAVLDREGK